MARFESVCEQRARACAAATVAPRLASPALLITCTAAADPGCCTTHCCIAGGQQRSARGAGAGLKERRDLSSAICGSQPGENHYAQLILRCSLEAGPKDQAGRCERSPTLAPDHASWSRRTRVRAVLGLQPAWLRNFAHFCNSCAPVEHPRPAVSCASRRDTAARAAVAVLPTHSVAADGPAWCVSQGLHHGVLHVGTHASWNRASRTLSQPRIHTS